MSELSPAAQAVFDAYKEALDGVYIDGEWVPDEAGQIAAALRAAANNLRSEMSSGGRTTLFVRGVLASAEALEEIAEELESF